MKHLYKSIKGKGHCVLEMSSGTGKTITLLSLITSYQFSQGESKSKLLYCTRTVPEMEKVLIELKKLYEMRIKEYGLENNELLGIGLSSRSK